MEGINCRLRRVVCHCWLPSSPLLLGLPKPLVTASDLSQAGTGSLERAARHVVLWYTPTLKVLTGRRDSTTSSTAHRPSSCAIAHQHTSGRGRMEGSLRLDRGAGPMPAS